MGRWTLADIAVKYAEIGRKDKALKLLSQAFQTAKNTKHHPSKPLYLSDVALRYAKVGEKGKAAEALSRALQFARRVDRDDKLQLLALIAISCAELKDERGHEVRKILKGILRERL